MGRRAVWMGACAGIIVGLAVGGGILVVGRDDERAAAVPHDEAARQFVDAWRRSRTEELYVRSTFHRETAQGAEMDTEQELVQRPPDYLVRQFGTVDGRIDDKPVRCQPQSDGEITCQVVDTGTPLTPYGEQIDQEVATVESYFFGDAHPLYRVALDGEGCYELTITRLYPAPPYGDYARFCFDDLTGARTYKEVRQKEGTDLVKAVEIRTDVTDQDFAL